MKQRGRQSKDGAAAVAPLVERPPPPEHLGEIAAELWQACVDDNVPSYFRRESLPILEAYCIAYERMRRAQAIYNQKLAEAEDGQGLDYQGIGLFRDLAAKESSLMNSCATKLRLTPQSMYSAKKGKDAGNVGPKPWEQ